MLPPGGSETELVISKTGPRPRRGERILHKMQLGDDAPAIAKRLTMEDLPDAAGRLQGCAKCKSQSFPPVRPSRSPSRLLCLPELLTELFQFP
jgi:hypothetical protein